MCAAGRGRGEGGCTNLVAFSLLASDWLACNHTTTTLKPVKHHSYQQNIMKQLLSKMQAKMLHYCKLSLPLKKPSTLQENSQVSLSIQAHLEERLYTARVTCHSTKKCSNDCARQNPTPVQCTCTWEDWWSVGGPFLMPEQQMQLVVLSFQSAPQGLSL